MSNNIPNPELIKGNIGPNTNADSMWNQSAQFIIQSDAAGFDMNKFEIQTALCIVEEAGEFIQEYRRAAGMARKQGDWTKVGKELADVILACQIFAQWVGFDLELLISEAWNRVLTREQKES